MFPLLKRAWGNVAQTLVWYWIRLTTLGTKGNCGYWGRDISLTPGCLLNLGNELYLGDRCTFEVGLNPRAELTIGSHSWLSHDCHISSVRSVTIGEHVLIGEFVSIRDTTHSYDDATVPIKNQSDIAGTVCIEDGVWIGRGCLIQGRPEGIVVGRGAIIAANSVVSRSVPPMEVWGGVPARFIKERPMPVVSA